MENTSNESKEEYKAGKSISVAANERLKKIREQVNKGDYKKRYSEREIISEAVLAFSEKHIERLREKRQSGRELTDGLVTKFFADSSESSEMSIDEFYKTVVAPALEQHLVKKSKSSKKVKTDQEVK